MPRFTTAPVDEVIPKRRSREPSQLTQTRQQFRRALRDALVDRHEALVVELEDDEKPLTVRNRLKKAAESLGLEDVTIRRRKDRIIAYRAEADEVPKVGSDDALGG